MERISKEFGNKDCIDSNLIDTDLDPVVRYTSFVVLVEETVLDSTPNLVDRPTSCNQFKKSSSPPCPWWNKACDKLVWLKRAAFLKFRHTDLREDMINYKKADAKAKYGRRKIKRDNFRLFCEGLTKHTNPNYLWRKIKSF